MAIRLTRTDANDLAAFFRDGQVTVAVLKAQNYECFATFSKDRGGEIDRDGAIVRRIDSAKARTTADDRNADFLRERVINIRARMQVLRPEVCWRAWWSLQHAFSRPTLAFVDNLRLEAGSVSLARLMMQTRAARQRGERDCKRAAAKLKIANPPEPTAHALELAVVAAIDLAMTLGARDEGFLTDMRTQAVELLDEAAAAWTTARESFERHDRISSRDLASAAE